MKCSKCGKKTDEDNSFYTKDKKSATCNDCVTKLLKKSRCCLCNRKMEKRFFTYFGKDKFMCIDCVKGIKSIKA